MIPVEEAIRLVTEQTRPLASERLICSDASGRVLSENIIADSDLPPFGRANGWLHCACGRYGFPFTSLTLVDLIQVE